jgi:hypothetical protein
MTGKLREIGLAAIFYAFAGAVISGSVILMQQLLGTNDWQTAIYFDLNRTITFVLAVALILGAILGLNWIPQYDMFDEIKNRNWCVTLFLCVYLALCVALFLRLGPIF